MVTIFSHFWLIQNILPELYGMNHFSVACVRLTQCELNPAPKTFQAGPTVIRIYNKIQINSSWNYPAPWSFLGLFYGK